MSATDEKQKERLASPGGKPPRKKIITVVDDEPMIVEIMVDVLEPEGFIVSGYTDPLKALADLEGGAESDALLTDIGMPGMDGYELFKKVREKRPELPIVFMTGYGYDLRHNIVKARQKGLRYCLYKPFEIQQLYDTINDVFNGEDREKESR